MAHPIPVPAPSPGPCPPRAPSLISLTPQWCPPAPPPHPSGPDNLLSVLSGHDPNQLTQKQDKCPAGPLLSDAWLLTPMAP